MGTFAVVRHFLPKHALFLSNWSVNAFVIHWISLVLIMSVMMVPVMSDSQQERSWNGGNISCRVLKPKGNSLFFFVFHPLLVFIIMQCYLSCSPLWVFFQLHPYPFRHEHCPREALIENICQTFVDVSEIIGKTY